MARRHTVTQEIKSETKIWKNLYLQDFIFVAAGVMLTLILRESVHEKLKIAFVIFSLVVCLILTFPSRTNPGRRNWQAFVLNLQNKQHVYRYQEVEVKKDEKSEGRRYSRFTFHR